MSPGIRGFVELRAFRNGCQRGIMPFAKANAARYICDMSGRSTSGSWLVRVALAAITVGGFTGVAFAAWIGNGSAMLMALTASGLSWCF
jgi:hypothetical protein